FRAFGVNCKKLFKKYVKGEKTVSKQEEIDNAKRNVTKSKDELDNALVEMNNSKKELERCSRDLENILNTAREKIFAEEKVIPISSDIKILHIDDLENSFNNSDKIKEKIGLLFEKIKKLIISPANDGRFDPDVILLDLRLFPAYDELHRHDVEKMSGALLLKMLREEYLGIPIIVTTASNKVWTYAKLIELGADAYWIKEGLDEKYDVNDSKSNPIFSFILSLLLKEFSNGKVK
ncbi:MAG: response regulator, partial [Bacteroidetes bacterium]|nr:response regulator [Bacteroidota bacterium]